MSMLWLIVCVLFVTVLHLQKVGSLQFSSDLLNVTRLPRNCEETVNSTKLNTSDNNVQGHTTHVCSRHISMETAAFRCYSYNNSTLNFRAILRGLQRKSLKFKQISLITFQQYLASRTPYISDWSLYTQEPCLRIIRHCIDCDSPNDIVDLHRDYSIIKTIHEIIGSLLQEEKSFLPFSEQVQSLKFLHRSIKQLLCELHTFLLVLGFHDVIHGFVGDVINSPDWCVFESASTRYERDVYLLRQVSAVSSEIYHRYSMLIP